MDRALTCTSPSAYHAYKAVTTAASLVAYDAKPNTDLLRLSAQLGFSQRAATSAHQRQPSRTRWQRHDIFPSITPLEKKERSWKRPLAYQLTMESTQ